MGRIIVYAHWFKNHTKKKFLELIIKKRIVDNWDFIVEGQSVDSISEDGVRNRIERLLLKYPKDELVFVMEGFSPLVAVIYKIVKEEYKMKCVYYVFQKDEVVEKEI